MHSLSAPLSLTIEWLTFTLPIDSVQDSMHVIGGDWTTSEVGVRGDPSSWMTACAGRGVGKLGTGALRSTCEVCVRVEGHALRLESLPKPD